MKEYVLCIIISLVISQQNMVPLGGGEETIIFSVQLARNLPPKSEDWSKN